MNLTEYQRAVESIPFGKRLPGALYVVRDEESDFGTGLNQLLAQLVIVFEVGPEFNLIKFRTDELKVSFLCYPEFMGDPHPSLRHAITIDLSTGKARHTDYAGNLNPPILHRKESFLPQAHPARVPFAALTRAEEEVGLYEHAATIGFKLNWERLLREKGVIIEGHTLQNAESGVRSAEQVEKEGVPLIERHKTALTRYELSKPVKSLLEYGLLKTGTTFFDYGCGQGSDARGLQALGHEAEGWDPVHRPSVAKREADIVNLGYVLNVIEEPAERLDALVEAFRHAKRLLVVSGLINETVDTATARIYGDGVLTRANTFQKFFEQQELQQYIEDALDVTAVPVALGIFYVFRDPAEHQDFISARTRRVVDWTQISARLGLGGPQTMWKTLYEEHQELLDAFGKLSLELGRIPEPTEYERLAEVSERVGSAKRALRAYVQGGGAEGVDWEQVRVRFGIGQPPKRRWEILYEENSELLEAFWAAALELGREPAPEEFPRHVELVERVGSAKAAMRLLVQRGGGSELETAAANRRNDLLVYLGLANLRRKVPFGQLSQSLRLDIRSFFGDYQAALRQGLELLYAAGDPGEIELACEGLKIGWQDEQALYVHKSAVPELPGVLRAYVGCATALFGDIEQADLLKIHKASGKVTFLKYDDFESKPLPELQHRIKVNLRTRWVEAFDHSADGQLLYFKERFVDAKHPGRKLMENFSSKLRNLGILENIAQGPRKLDFAEILSQNNLNENLNKRRVAAKS